MRTNKEIYNLFRKQIINSTKITKSINTCNNVKINSYLFYVSKKVRNVYPSQLVDDFVEIEFGDYKILIYEKIYNRDYNIFDYFRIMKRYKCFLI